MRPADSTEFGDEDENEHVKRYLARTLMKANEEASVVKRNIATEARLWTKGATVASVIAAALAFPTGPVAAAQPAKNGTTLAASKTLDICILGDTTWRYSGEISVWNDGAINTSGLAISDCVQYKIGTTWASGYCPAINLTPAVIPAGTVKETAITYPFEFEGAPLTGAIRNEASITILNHSGSIGTPKGPTVRYTFDRTTLAACLPTGCVFSQGYWGNKPGVVWPFHYDRNASFYLSGQTWQQVLDTSVNVSPGYYQLAHQFIAATLNKANGAPVPASIQTLLDTADAWFLANTPAVCTSGSSCGTQKTWAAILDDYNNGVYPGGPQHCE
jgi:hypothetical protein